MTGRLVLRLERERERDADADRECIVADCRRPGVELDLHGAV